MKMKTKDNIWEYFQSIPDEYLVLLAELDWKGLEQLCVILTLDIELSKQKKNPLPLS
jgi:hypothetical protein